MTAMDILTILNNAGAANKAFIVTKFDNYERIGIKTTDNFNMFTPNKGEHIFPFTLVTNAKENNVSVRNMIKGTAKINPKVAKKVNLPDTIECVQFKNYTLIKDGKIHTPNITVRLDESVLENLKAMNVPIDKTVIEPNKLTVTLNLKDMVVAENYITDEETVDLVKEINTLTIQDKVIKSINPENEPSIYTPEQLDVLNEYGIVNGVYNYIDPKEEGEVTTYKTTEVLYQIKGAATIPSIKKALETAKRNAITQEVVDIYNNYKTINPETLVDLHKDIKAKLQNNKIKLMNTRIAYVNNNGVSKTIENNGITLNIKINEKEKKFS